VQKTWRIKISRLSAKTYASVVHQIINLTRRRATTTPGSHNDKSNYAYITFIYRQRKHVTICLTTQTTRIDEFNSNA